MWIPVHKMSVRQLAGMITFRLHILTRVYKRPYSTAAIFNKAPRHASADTCMQLRVLFHTHAPAEQQVTVTLTHHQLQAGSSLKGLSTIIIAISKEALAASGTRLLAFTTFSSSKCRCPMSTLIYPKDWKKRGRVIRQSFRRGLWFKRPGQCAGVETKRPGSRVFPWLVRKSEPNLYMAVEKIKYN